MKKLLLLLLVFSTSIATYPKPFSENGEGIFMDAVPGFTKHSLERYAEKRPGLLSNRSVGVDRISQPGMAPVPSGITGAEFTPEYLQRVVRIDKSADSIISVAKNIFEEITRHQRFIDILTGKELLEFPVGIKKQFSPTSTLTVGVVNARFHPLYAEVDMFARLELTELNAELFFAAANVKLSEKGGIYEEAKLHLVSDLPVIRQGGRWLLTFRGDFRRNGLPNEESFITIDCEGTIKELSLAADVRISKHIAVPLKRNGNYAFPDQLEPSSGASPVNNKSYVGASFKMHTTDSADFLFELDLPPFELRPLKGWGFEFKKCVLDLSDTNNYSGMTFPEVYKDNGFLIRGQRELWRGFYAKEVQVMLPEEFRITGSEERIRLGVEHFIIDHYGLSGEFYVSDVIPLEKGNAGGWRFSVEELKAQVVANTFTGAGFSGKVVLPLSKAGEKRALEYEGFISPFNEYLLDVAVDKEIYFDVFRSRVKLFSGSYVRFEVVDHTFYPEANLTGVMQFDQKQFASLDSLDSGVAKNGMEKLEVGGLLFQDLRLRSKGPPFIEVGYLGLNDTLNAPRFMGFDLGVYRVALKNQGPSRASLEFNAFIALDDEGVKGDVGMRVEASLHSGDLTEWEFERFVVDSVGVDIRKRNFELSGQLHFLEDNDRYGDALSGSLRLYAETLKLEIGAKAIFGRKGELQYWFADAYGAPHSRGDHPFKIYNLSGGLYHHMKKSGYHASSSNPSGFLYEPDAGTRLGFKGMVAFEVKKKMAFTGIAGLEMSFNTKAEGGGVRRVGFYGAASLMNPQGSGIAGSTLLGDVKEVQELQAKREEALGNTHELSLDKQGINYFATEVFPDILTGKEIFAAQVALDYDLTNDVYWGMFDTFLNLGGIRGDGDKNRIGYLEFYSDPQDWYVYVGTPEKRLGVRDIPVGPLLARANLYFMTGTILPPPAAPPKEVSDILNLPVSESLFNEQYANQLSEGQGYAIGASLALGVGFDWGLIYANVEAGVGFDLMIKNFGGLSCNGESGQIGMNGWYASGQSYAYLQGAIGVRVDLFMTKMDIPVLKGGMALLAQAQLPSPWYIKGYAGVELHVLGHIHIKTRLKVVIGEPCEYLNKNGLEEIAVIADIRPQDESESVSVFETVNVALNLAEGEMIRVETLSGKRYYKALLDTLVVYEGNKRIPGIIAWNEARDLLTWTPPEILPSDSDIIVWVKLRFLEYSGEAWQPVIKNGIPVTEERKITFKTGEAPDHIPYDNIAGMFPVVSQKYFLPGEFDKGYIQLKRGQDYLFKEGLENQIFLRPLNGGKPISCDYNYDKTNNILRYEMPSLQSEQEYSFSLETVSARALGTSGEIVYREVNKELNLSSHSIGKTAKNEASFTRLTFSFTSSRYQTFKEKIRAMPVSGTSMFTDGEHDVAGFSIQTVESEPWDIHDLAGTRYNNGQPFIRPVAYMTDAYFESEINPLLYENYPPAPGIILSRDTLEFGFIPGKAILPSSVYIALTRAESTHDYLTSQFPYHWRLARVYKEDFKDLQQQLVERYLRGDRVDLEAYEKYKHLINGIFPFVNIEKYKVYFHYILPTRTTGNKIRIDYQNTF